MSQSHPLGLLMETSTSVNFETAYTEVQNLWSKNIDDAIVPVNDVKFTPRDESSILVDVPGIGPLKLNDWTKRQLAKRLGVRWDEWFDTKKVSALQICDEISRRTQQSKYTVKFRSRRLQHEEPKAVGTLRAMVSPSYAALDDVYVFDMLEDMFRDRISDWVFLRTRYGNEGFECDQSSHFTVAMEPFNVGSPNEPDWMYHGIHIRNSEVGHCAFSISSFLLRLVCHNGAIFRGGDFLSVNIVHRVKDVGDALYGAGQKLKQLMESFKTNEDIVRRWVNDKTKIDIAREILQFVTRFKLPDSFRKRVMEAWNYHPEKTKWGLFNAVTRAAQDVKDYDKRFLIESSVTKHLTSSKDEE
jgi:hypothetical protein